MGVIYCPGHEYYLGTTVLRTLAQRHMTHADELETAPVVACILPSAESAEQVQAKRYKITTPLVAIQLHRRGKPLKTMTFLPRNVTVGLGAGSDIAPGMVEVTWRSKLYAVFQFDLQTRATPLDRGELAVS